MRFFDEEMKTEFLVGVWVIKVQRDERLGRSA
jgi:hypothetical protein